MLLACLSVDQSVAKLVVLMVEKTADVLAGLKDEQKVA